MSAPTLEGWTETILDVDLDASVPCMQKGCPNEAVWLGRLYHVDGAVCTNGLACTPCKIKTDMLVAGIVFGLQFQSILMGGRGALLCGAHGGVEVNVKPPITWTPL